MHERETFSRTWWSHFAVGGCAVKCRHAPRFKPEQNGDRPTHHPPLISGWTLSIDKKHGVRYKLITTLNVLRLVKVTALLVHAGCPVIFRFQHWSAEHWEWERKKGSVTTLELGPLSYKCNKLTILDALFSDASNIILTKTSSELRL